MSRVQPSKVTVVPFREYYQRLETRYTYFGPLKAPQAHRSTWVLCYMNLLIKTIIKKYRLHEQIEDFLTYKSKFCTTIGQRREMLLEMLKMARIEDIREMTIQDLKTIEKRLTGRYSTFQRDSYIKVLRCFIRYYRQRRLTDINPSWIREDGNIVIG